MPDITKTVQDEEGNDIKARDAEAIQLADAKINEIRSAFTGWLRFRSIRGYAARWRRAIRRGFRWSGTRGAAA